MNNSIYKHILIKLFFISLTFSADAETERKTKPTVALTKNSFHEVTEKLNKGGIHFSYQGTNEFLRQYDATFSCFEKLCKNVIADEKHCKKVIHLLNSIEGLISRSGLTEVSGIGMSSISTQKNTYHNRIFIHHFPEENQGLLWQLFADKTGTIECMKYIPEDAVLAGAFDLQLAKVRKQFLDETEKIAKSAKEIFAEFVKEHKMTDTINEIDQSVPDLDNFDLENFLGALDDRAFFFATIDRKNPKNIIIMDTAVKLPNPSMLLILQVKNDKAFLELEKYFKEGHKTETKESLKLTFDYPKTPLTFNPVIQQKDNLLLIASNPGIIGSFEGLKNGKGKSLFNSSEIYRLSKNMPEKSNGFFYMSPELMPLIHRLFKENIEKILENDDDLKSKKPMHFLNAGMELINIFTFLKENAFIFSTIETKKDGLMFYSNSATPINSGADFFNMSSVGPGIASLTTGKELFYASVSEDDENKQTCSTNLKKIKKALDRFALDNNGRYPKQYGILGFGELIEKKYLTDINAIKCPENKNESKPIQFPLEENMCDYIYFGNLKDIYNRNLPLVFDKPGKNTHIRILFINGKISIMKKKVENCRELIRILHLNFRYPEQIYNHLDKIATRYDKLNSN